MYSNVACSDDPLLPYRFREEMFETACYGQSSLCTVKDCMRCKINMIASCNRLLTAIVSLCVTLIGELTLARGGSKRFSDIFSHTHLKCISTNHGHVLVKQSVFVEVGHDILPPCIVHLFFSLPHFLALSLSLSITLSLSFPFQHLADRTLYLSLFDYISD